MAKFFLFHGADSYSRMKKIQNWQKEFIKKHGEANLDIFDAKDIAIPNLIQNCQTMPFIGEKRLIIVRNLLKNTPAEKQKILAVETENLPEWTILVFSEDEPPDKRLSLFKKLQKIGTVEEFNVPQGAQLTNYILARGQNKFAYKEAQYLAHLCSDSLWQLENEIKKLLLYAKNGQISAKTIDLLVTPQLHNSIFELTDAIGQKKTQRGIELLNLLIQKGEDPFKIFFMIVRQFRLLIQIRDLIEHSTPQTEIARILKQHPYTTKIAAQQTKNFSKQTLKAIYLKLHLLDKSIKTGKIENSSNQNTAFILELEKFIIKSSG